MGHTRLGAIPKTRKWNELIEQVAGLEPVLHRRIVVHDVGGRRNQKDLYCTPIT
jgi:hypothetical protein